MLQWECARARARVCVCRTVRPKQMRTWRERAERSCHHRRLAEIHCVAAAVRRTCAASTAAARAVAAQSAFSAS